MHNKINYIALVVDQSPPSQPAPADMGRIRVIPRVGTATPPKGRMKTCHRCKKAKHPIYGFAPSTSGTKDGRMNVCRDCFNERRRQAYARKNAA